MEGWVPALALAVSLMSLAMVIATYVRAGDWEKSKAGESIKGEISAVKNRVTVIETKIFDLPTKADIARLTSEVDAVQDMVKLVRESVMRIEGYMMDGTK